MDLSEGEDRITRLHETESGYVSVSVIGEEIGFKQKRFTKRYNGKRNRRSLDFAPNRNKRNKKGEARRSGEKSRSEEDESERWTRTVRSGAAEKGTFRAITQRWHWSPVA